MLRNALAGLAAFLALSGTAPAQTVDDIIAHSFLARGGLDKVKAIRSLRMTGRATVAPGTEAAVTIEIKRPSSLRLEFAFDEARTRSRPTTGAGRGGSPPARRSPARSRPRRRRRWPQQTDLEGPLADYAAKGHQVALLGREPVDGADAWKLRVTRKDGDVEYHYIDAKTYLPVKVAVERTARGTKIQSETRLGDYRKIGAGYLWPFLLESGAAGRSERQRMKLKDVEVDP